MLIKKTTPIKWEIEQLVSLVMFYLKSVPIPIFLVDEGERGNDWDRRAIHVLKKEAISALIVSKLVTNQKQGACGTLEWQQLIQVKLG